MPCIKRLTRLLAKALIATAFIHSLAVITRHEYCFYKSIHRARREKCVCMCPCVIVCFHTHSALIIQASDTYAAKADGKSCEKLKHSVIHTDPAHTKCDCKAHNNKKQPVLLPSLIFLDEFSVQCWFLN